MAWNYRIILHDTDKQSWLALHEVFYDEGGNVQSWTEGPITFVADPDEGAAGIACALERALADAQSHRVLQESDLEAGRREP